MSKSINPMLFFKPGAEPIPVRPRSHRLDEFAASYSLAGCSPALPASASPTGIHLQPPPQICQPLPLRNPKLPLDLKARPRQTIITGVGQFR